MGVSSIARAALVICIMLALIFNSATCIFGCSEGIDLCIKSVIPALFPFLVLSPLLTGSMSFKMPCWLRKTLKIPDGGDSLWITGCLGGYPVGAQCIAQAAQTGQISKADARRLMAFCCNCGPGFIFGICSSFFMDRWAAWALWLCHIAASGIIGWIIPGNQEQGRVAFSAPKISVVDAFGKALKAMAQICGWVILFRCLLELLRHLGIGNLSAPVRVIILGMLELTNGCLYLKLIANEALRFLICEALLCFGGLCVAMQTASVANRIPIDLYLPGKIGQSIISTMLAAVVWTSIHSQWHLVICITVPLMIFLTSIKVIFKKYSRNLCPAGV